MDDFLGKNGKKLLYLAGFAGLLYLIFQYIFPLAAPFLVAFLIVRLCNPWLERVRKKTHIRKEILLAGILLMLTALILSGIWGLLSWGTVHAADIGEGMEQLQVQMDRALHDCCLFLEQNFGVDAGEAETAVLERMNQLAENMRADLLPKAAKQSWESVRSILGAAAFLGVGFISSMLLCRDYESIVEKLGENSMTGGFLQFLEKTVSLLGGYLRAQAVILLVISAIAVTGLLLARVRGAVALGIFAGLLDALPFIGTGIVLFPVALWQLLWGNGYGAAAAVVVYVLCAAARELLEPRLLGRQVGIRPVVMLFGVYAGVRLFGLAGIFLGPLYLVFFREGADRIRESC